MGAAKEAPTHDLGGRPKAAPPESSLDGPQKCPQNRAPNSPPDRDPGGPLGCPVVVPRGVPRGVPWWVPWGAPRGDPQEDPQRTPQGISRIFSRRPKRFWINGSLPYEQKAIHLHASTHKGSDWDDSWDGFWVIVGWRLLDFLLDFGVLCVFISQMTSSDQKK